MIVTEEPRQATTDLPETEGTNVEALIKEARQRQRRRWLSAVALTVVVIAVVAIAVIALRSNRPTRTSGANATSRASVPPPCSPGQIQVQFWYTPIGMGKDMPGFNLKNVGSRSCALPADPTAVRFVNKLGRPLAPVKVASSLGPGMTTDDFAMLPLPVKYLTETVPLRHHLVLRPGGTAVLPLLAFDNYEPSQPCFSGRGWVEIGLSRTRALEVRLPSSEGLFGGPPDPTGSVIFSCAQVLVFPFLTWKEAVGIVGPPADPILLEGRAAYLYKPSP